MIQRTISFINIVSKIYLAISNFCRRPVSSPKTYNISDKKQCCMAYNFFPLFHFLFQHKISFQLVYDMSIIGRKTQDSLI